MGLKDWIPLAVQAGLWLLTMGLFFGALKQTVNGITKTLGEYADRLGELDGARMESANDRARINSRLDALEQGDSVLQRLNDNFNRMIGAVEVRLSHLEESSSRTARELAVVHRQLANFASGRIRPVSLLGDDEDET